MFLGQHDSTGWECCGSCGLRYRAIHVSLNVSVGVKIPSDLEPMTGIEPAYSAWEAVFWGMLKVGLVSSPAGYLLVAEFSALMSTRRLDWAKRKYKRK
ncbi:hypothetical protein SEA_SPOOKY_41 [Gordonia phage Spooky]|nr:hypothetical protein SEA_SPOOKY_41 [Gordonia phage Spooky]